MKPSRALDTHRQAVIAAVHRHKAENARVFGSVARGTDNDESDIDILVDALPGATLFDLGGLQIELEELLGVRTDVSTPGDLPEYMRGSVLAEARAL